MKISSLLAFIMIATIVLMMPAVKAELGGLSPEDHGQVADEKIPSNEACGAKAVDHPAGITAQAVHSHESVTGVTQKWAVELRT